MKRAYIDFNDRSVPVGYLVDGIDRASLVSNASPAFSQKLRVLCLNRSCILIRSLPLAVLTRANVGTRGER